MPKQLIPHQTFDHPFLHQIKIFLPPYRRCKGIILRVIKRSVKVIQHKPPSAILIRSLPLLNGTPQGNILVKAHIFIINIQLNTIEIYQTLDINQFRRLLIIFRNAHIVFRDESEHCVIIVPCIPLSYRGCPGINHPNVSFTDSVVVPKIILLIPFPDVIKSPILSIQKYNARL